MKKSIYKNIRIVLSVICILLIFTACGNEKSNIKENDLSLEMLKVDDEYQFNTIKWGLTSDEVAKLLSNKLEVDTAREPFPKGYTLYKSKSDYNLDGKICRASFEFQNEGLNIVQFNFQLTDQDANWADKQVKKLVQLYGAESEKIERENEEMHLKTTAYKWETDQTMLQFILMTSDSGEERVIIALVNK